MCLLCGLSKGDTDRTCITVAIYHPATPTYFGVAFFSHHALLYLDIVPWLFRHDGLQVLINLFRTAAQLGDKSLEIRLRCRFQYTAVLKGVKMATS